MRRFVIAIVSVTLLLGAGACGDTFVSPTDLQEEVAAPATVRANFEPSSFWIVGMIELPPLFQTLAPGEEFTGERTVTVLLGPHINSLTLEVCPEHQDDYGDWLSATPADFEPFDPPGSVIFSVVVGPPSDAEIKTHEFEICAVANGTTFTSQPVTIIVVQDDISPVITLLGSDPVSVGEGDTYTDAGATAWDNIDGDITDEIITVNPVDTDVPGTYTVTYNVSDAAGNSAVEVTRTVVVEESTTIGVAIDIKPGSDPNSINLGSNGKGNGKVAGPNAKIAVALFSTVVFDATLVDVSTVSLGDLTEPDTPVALKKNGTYHAGVEDVDGDGLLDMIFHFSRAELIANGDLTEASNRLYLTGTHVDGDIEGWDAVRVIY